MEVGEENVVDLFFVWISGTHPQLRPRAQETIEDTDVRLAESRVMLATRMRGCSGDGGLWRPWHSHHEARRHISSCTGRCAYHWVGVLEIQDSNVQFSTIQYSTLLCWMDGWMAGWQDGQSRQGSAARVSA